MKPDETPVPAAPQEGKKSSKPITHYLIILFAAALALLLISFFMQQRNHEVLLELNDSMTQQQADLQSSKAQLQLQVADLRDQLKETEAALKNQSQAAKTAQEQVQAVEWLRQIQRAMSRSYWEAAELRDAFEATGLNEQLPDEPAVEGKASPKEDYEEICQRLP